MERIWRNLILLTGDVIILSFALYLALKFRFDGSVLDVYLQQGIQVGPEYVLGSVAIFVLFRLYSSLWRYASITELVNVILAAICSTLWLGALTLVQDPFGHPRSVVIIAGMIIMILAGGWRLSIRVLRHLRGRLISPQTRLRLLIVGVGVAGAMIVQELLKHGHKPIGILDDNMAKQRRQIHGVQVVGRLADLKNVIRKYNVAELIVAMPSAPRSTLRAMFEKGQQLGVTVRALPALHEIANGRGVITIYDPWI